MTPPPKLVPVLPPENLMQETRGPQWTPRTNGEMLKWAIETDRALMQCNADKRAMQTYSRAVQEEEN